MLNDEFQMKCLLTSSQNMVPDFDDQNSVSQNIQCLKQSFCKSSPIKKEKVIVNESDTILMESPNRYYMNASQPFNKNQNSNQNSPFPKQQSSKQDKCDISVYSINQQQQQFQQSDTFTNIIKQTAQHKTIGKKEKSAVDRFIPNRKSSKLHLAFSAAHENDENSNTQHKLSSARNSSNDSQSSQTLTNKSIAEMFKCQVLQIQHTHNNYSSKNKMKNGNFHNDMNIENFQNKNIFRYQNGANENELTSINENTMQQQVFGQQNDIRGSFCNNFSASIMAQNRKIPKNPFKILDAPALQDDFYLNLLDWSSSNVLAVALESTVYLWSGNTNKVSKLFETNQTEPVTSVIWNLRGSHLAIGTNEGDVQIYDIAKGKQVQIYKKQHTARIGALAWSDCVLASGSRDKSIIFKDFRQPGQTSNGCHCVRKMLEHKQEVCGLKWSFDNQQLASGGNDNKLLIWNMHSSSPVRKISSHSAAVKAIAWSPHQHGLLASGGGTADRSIRFWNTLSHSSHQELQIIETNSQVCNLMFGKNVNELVSSHGYSMNQIVLWKYPQMNKLTTLTGHTTRVLYLAMSPNGETIVSGAGDETLRFWNVFPKSTQYSGLSDNKSILIGNAKELR